MANADDMVYRDGNPIELLAPSSDVSNKIKKESKLVITNGYTRVSPSGCRKRAQNKQTSGTAHLPASNVLLTFLSNQNMEVYILCDFISLYNVSTREITSFYPLNGLVVQTVAQQYITCTV